jgi:hypothetical protein
MRCKNCDYPLWNLTGQKCPECGTPFRPDEFEYVRNSVQFCCPYCDQAYYGTSRRGHLVPASFDCVSCGHRVHMNEMVLRPAEGITEEQTRLDRMPWLNRAATGRLKAWLKTIGRSMVSPVRLIDGAPAEASTAQAWWFACLTLAAVLFCGGGLPMLAFGVLLTITGGSDALELLTASGSYLLGGVVAWMILIALWGLVTHGILHITGGAAHGLGRTYQALCYSAGPSVIAAVPCLGLYLLWIPAVVWWMVSAVLMVSNAQKVGGGRAAVATLMFPVIGGVLTFGGFFAMMFFSVQQAAVATVQSTTTMSASVETQRLVDALLDYATDHDGAGPPNAIALLQQPDFDGSAFIATGSQTALTDVPIGNFDLESIGYLMAAERQSVLEQFIDEQAGDIVAHRVGDFVFTYHGIDLDDADPGLWTVIRWPDRSTLPARWQEAAWVGYADGRVVPLTPFGFDGFLTQQNALRAAEGLPPLPHPRNVGQDEPVTTGDVSVD